MTDNELKLMYTEICKHLAERKLKPAFDQLEKLINDSGMLLYMDEWRTLEQNYHYMLQYTLEGIKDPERQKVYRKLIVSVFELADKIYDAIRLKKSPSIEYEKKRILEQNYSDKQAVTLQQLESFSKNKDLASLGDDKEEITDKMADELKKHQQMVIDLFYRCWFTNKTTVTEQALFRQIIHSDMIHVPYRSMLVTALTLSLVRYFDENKFNLLFEAYEHSETEISQRALVGLVINLYKYDKRMPFYSHITSRLKLLNEDSGFRKNLETIIIQFIRSRETEKIQQKIKDEIIPEMIKISPNIQNKINLRDLMDENSGDDKNPEWEELFKDSPGLMDKMEEFSELQMEGADVFIGSFSMLKSFPFFSHIHNWFIPFFTENPDLNINPNKNQSTIQRFLNTINSAPILCNSDKYSFCFSINNLPVENLDLLAEGMNAEINQFNELQNDEELTDPGRKAGFISNQVIQDLYRFYRLHPRKTDFEDIFSWRFDFHNSLTLGDLLKEDDKMFRNVAEYFFKKGYYEDAAEIFKFMLKQEKNGELYQKLGFCYQKSGNYKKALKAYKRAELFELNPLWNYKKIALCYRNIRKPKKALEYYLLAESMDNEDLNTELNIGHCHLELGQFNEALKYYFKVEYLANDNKKAWRPIGWCSFVTGKKQQALKYFKKLIENDPGKHDLMNMGHVKWSLGNRKEALDCYKKSMGKGYFSEDEFFDVFAEDLHYLLEQGVDIDDVPIMLDQLRYFVEA
ncbi:MAG: hypothetical protein CSA36_03925 [Draconibacterium sp.]|nr:MAG: hypothetical protein CSA36_03925 [Draconibacterium sp.]